MVTVSRSSVFQRNLLLSIGGVFLLFAICFCIYQYQREKEYKIDILHSRLQMYNYDIMQVLGEDGITSRRQFLSYVRQHPLKGLRVSVIDRLGRVLLDSNEPHPDSLDNHLGRKEIQQALRDGNGFDLKRMSHSTHETYFYSATRFKRVIVRTAVPYSADLTQSLRADNTYIYFSIVLTLLLGSVLYISTRRISRHISYLREFAINAENGEPLDHELERHLPDDELGDISHTIIMLGYLESILDNPNMPEDKKKHFLERCYAQSMRMNKLLLDMSALTRLDEMDTNHFRNHGEYQNVDVVQIVRSILDDTALALQQKGITPRLKMPQQVIIVGDSSLIYSIFRNLVDNVIAYATGASLVEITCKPVVSDNSKLYEFTVSDNGPGVEPQHLEHIFERFYRVDKGRSRKLGGTGLGLAIVKNAVTVHGGTVTAFPTPGGGLTVMFTLQA